MLKPEVQLLRARVLSNFRQIGPRFRRLATACKAADPRAVSACGSAEWMIPCFRFAANIAQMSCLLHVEVSGLLSNYSKVNHV